MKIRPMKITDYASMVALWRATPGVRLVAADSEASISAFLARNPGMSFVAEERGALIGTAMCGHDGRRGFLYHVAVRADLRGRGIGSEMVRRCLGSLRQEGIDKCSVFVLADNELGKAFWGKGWTLREDIALFSKDI